MSHMQIKLRESVWMPLLVQTLNMQIHLQRVVRIRVVIPLILEISILKHVSQYAQKFQSNTLKTAIVSELAQEGNLQIGKIQEHVS